MESTAEDGHDSYDDDPFRIPTMMLHTPIPIIWTEVITPMAVPDYKCASIYDCLDVSATNQL